jgi:hypothetical protein
MTGAETAMSIRTRPEISQPELTGCYEEQYPSDEDKEVGERVGKGAHCKQLRSGWLCSYLSAYIYQYRCAVLTRSNSCSVTSENNHSTPQCCGGLYTQPQPVPTTKKPG